MTSSRNIDEIVREVVRRLASMPGGTRAPDNGSSMASPGTRADKSRSNSSTAAEPNDNATTRVASRLVTLANLKGLLQNQNVRQLEVPAGAVLTPSVRDVLRDRKIAVRYVDPRQAGHLPLLVASLLEQEPAAVWARRIDPLQATRVVDANSSSQVLEQLQASWESEGTRGVVFTRTPIATAWQANRNASFRAAWCSDVEMVERALREIQVNLLIVDPTARGGFEIQRLLECFLQG